MTGVAPGLVAVAIALVIGSCGVALVSSRARASGALLLLVAAGLTATAFALLGGYSTAAAYIVGACLVPASLAVLAYPAPTATHPIDFCLWVIVAGGCVVTLALAIVEPGVSGAVASIVLIAMVAHGWRVLEHEPDRIAGLWLAWAGLIAFVAGMPILAFAPAGDWAIALVAVPFAALALGMAVGVRRPELTDVRTLLVSTVVLSVVALSYLAAFVGTVAFLELVGIDDVPTGAFAVIGLVFAAGWHPLRVMLRGLIDELLFGDRPDPLVAAAVVADRIADDPLLTLRAVREALVLPYASISADGRELASSGRAVTDVVRFPLTLGENTIGEMTVGLRVGQLHLSAEDQQVLRIVGALLTQSLRSRLLAQQVTDSRAAAISAIEDERRRLRRDLHDGLGPTLSGIAHTAAAARNLIPTDPAAADELLARLRVDATGAVGEIRRLVYDMRPPALDELGLVGALEQQFAAVRTSTGGPMHVIVQAKELPPLPASIEVAAYRVATEAVTNAARHSGSDQAWLELEHDDGHLVLIVRDQGCHPEPWVPGVGVSSMRERTSEVGGTIELINSPCGATIRATLPLH